MEEVTKNVWVTGLAILDREAIVSCPYIPLRYQFHFLLPLLPLALIHDAER